MALAGVILAGGRSSRMGGQDKAMLSFADKTLIANAVERLAPQVGQLVISTNTDLSAGFPDQIDMVPDADDRRSGPLAGIHSALRWAGRQASPPQALISVAVDTPFFPRDFVRQLAGAVTDRPGTIAVAASADQRHPTFALWPLGLSDALGDYLEEGGRKVWAFIEAHPHLLVDFPPLDGIDPFFNINMPADLVKAGKYFGRQS